MQLGVASREREKGKEWLVVKDLINPEMLATRKQPGERYEE
jgi:hypothetical protein